MAFRTEDIERVKQSLNERHIDTIDYTYGQRR